MLPGLWVGSLQIKFNFFIEIFGTHNDFAIRARSGCHLSVEINGRRKYKSIVIVSVLSNEIDPARSAEKPGRGFVAPEELFYEDVLSTHWARIKGTESG
jgi:hypothetical protein